MTAADRDQQAFNYLKDQILQPGETIYWTGRPKPKFISTRHLFRVIVGVFLFTFAVSWTLGLHGNGSSYWTSGGIILAAAAYVIVKPYREYMKSHRTYYAVTSRRVVIITTDKAFNVTSLYADDIIMLQRMDYRDGTGDIQLRNTKTRSAGERNISVEFHDGLWGISDVETAANAIDTLRQGT